MSALSPPNQPRRRWGRRFATLGAVLLLAGVIVMIDVWSALGKRPAGDRQARLAHSPQYGQEAFVNELQVVEGDMLPILRKWIFGSKDGRVPEAPVPVVQRTAADYATAPDDLRITWFGHATLLIEIDGVRILTDPLWGDHASPGPLFGVERFFAPPLPLDDLPPIDAVILSHDHYDHLNEPTIRALRERVPRFIVPLGLGAHLEYWGVAPERIEELDWWDEVTVNGVTLVCTPARHFSGRTLFDRNATLWASWAILGTAQRAYFSGDTGLFPGFDEIGARLGPFDVTMIEIGAYNAAWPDVHMGPEQAVRAHQMVRGGLMVPIHWGTFNLAFHPWTEPAERVRVAAAAAGVALTLPRPGGFVRPADAPPPTAWWPAQPWQTAAENPIVSSGMPPR